MIRLFRVFVPTSVVGLLLTEFGLAFACYVAVVAYFEEIGAPIYLIYEGGFARIAGAVLSIVIGLYYNDLYTNLRVISRTLLIQQFCLAVGLAFIVQALLSYVDREMILPRWQMIFGSALALVVLPAWRMLYASLALKVLGSQRVLFLGDGKLARELAERIVRRPEFGLEAAGYLGDAGSPHGPIAAMPRVGDVGDLARVYDEMRPDMIVVAMDDRRGHAPMQTLLELKLRGTQIEDGGIIFEKVAGRVDLKSLRPSSLVFSSEMGPKRRHVTVQRYYSLLIALAGLTLSAPVMLLVAVLIKFTSAGPVIYRQKRVGFAGRVFEVYKFRSMYVDAEARTGAVWASKDDPRITPLGLWLRRLRIDELPQFFNVLKREMAIVGPRPERPEFVSTLSEMIPYYGQRHSILPGITGWAQINHKYGDTLEDTATKLEYDLYYLKHMSVALDAYVIFQTIKVMLLRRGSQ